MYEQVLWGVFTCVALARVIANKRPKFQTFNNLFGAFIVNK